MILQVFNFLPDANTIWTEVDSLTLASAKHWVGLALAELMFMVYSFELA